MISPVHKPRRCRLLPVVTLALWAWLLPSAAQAACVTGTAGATTSFSPGGGQCYVVPAGTSELLIVAVGGSGGPADLVSAAGGNGAVVRGNLAVSPGQQLDLNVAANGPFPGMGGQATYVNRGETLIVAGGGGGGGGSGDTVDGGLGGSAGAFAQTGAPGADSTSTAFGGSGGEGGTLSSGGAGGAGGAGNHFPGGDGMNGSLGIGGMGAGGGLGGGGAGGDGYYGGGGGGAGGESNGPTSGVGGGGGGGAGSSYTSATLSNAFISTAPSGTPTVQISALTAAPALSFSPAGGLSFGGTQPQQTVSGPLPLTITNTGTAALSISSLTMAGSDPGDFFVGSNGCLSQIAPAASCDLTVRFAPQGQGARSGALMIASNDPAGPAGVPLSGTGGLLPQGPSGPAGPAVTGPSGPAGPVGMQQAATRPKACNRLRKKLGRQKRARAKANSKAKRQQLTRNIKNTRRRLRTLGC